MIRLAYFERSDFEQLIEWIDTESLLVHWSGRIFRFPLTVRSLEWYLKDTNDIESSDTFIYKAIDVESGKTVGHISLGGISNKNRAARISRVLVGNNNARLKGVCRQMVSAVLKIGFEDLKLHRISLGVYDDNPSAVKCYERCGLTIEGINRDVLRYKGEWWSSIEMSMLENEWRKMHDTL